MLKLCKIRSFHSTGDPEATRVEEELVRFKALFFCHNWRAHFKFLM